MILLEVTLKDTTLNCRSIGPGTAALEEKGMRLRHPWWSGLVAAVLGGLVGVTAVAAAIHPLSTPLTYVLLEQATRDQIPLITSGFGRSDTADGRVFPYVFPVPITYWSQNTAKIRSLGQRDGGLAQLKGRTIGHVYLDNDLGRETLPMLDAQAAHYGFAVQHLPVQPPGLDQKATWLRVKVAQPDWVLLRTFGVSTPTALKEAALVGFPRDKIVGFHPTCAEQEMVAAGEGGHGLYLRRLARHGD
ncbi:MAG TPA: ABC transporter substrate-binding protein [Candidatus Tectomicrobia bacterium]|nr:ABC transporter substrate-binding protein [Candidatus Tectomicrobia bacterium]